MWGMEITWNWNLRFLSFTGTNMPTSLCTVCSWFHETTAEQSSCNRDRLAHRAYVIYYLAHSEHVCWLLIEAIFFPSHHEKLRTDFRLKHMGEKQPLARQSRRGRKDRCPSGFFSETALPLFPFAWDLDHSTSGTSTFLPLHQASHNPIPHHPRAFQSPGSPTQTSLGRQCSWRQAGRLVPGFQALEVAPGGWGPAAQPATPPPLCSRFVTSGPTARQSPYPLPNYAAPPSLGILDPHTTHKPGGRKTATSGQHLGVLTPYAPNSGSQEPPVTNHILWLSFNSSRCFRVPASHLNTQTNHSGLVLPKTDSHKPSRWRDQMCQFLGFLWNLESICNLKKLSCYCIKRDCYNYKKFSISLMITTKKKPLVDMQKIKESKHRTEKKNHKGR